MVSSNTKPPKRRSVQTSDGVQFLEGKGLAKVSLCSRGLQEIKAGWCQHLKHLLDYTTAYREPGCYKFKGLALVPANPGCYLRLRVFDTG